MTTATGTWQRLTAWLAGLSGKAADVLPVRVGGTDYRPTRSTPAAFHRVKVLLDAIADPSGDERRDKLGKEAIDR